MTSRVDTQPQPLGSGASTPKVEQIGRIQCGDSKRELRQLECQSPIFDSLVGSVSRRPLNKCKPALAVGAANEHTKRAPARAPGKDNLSARVLHSGLRSPTPSAACGEYSSKLGTDVHRPSACSFSTATTAVYLTGLCKSSVVPFLLRAVELS